MPRLVGVVRRPVGDEGLHAADRLAHFQLLRILGQFAEGGGRTAPALALAVQLIGGRQAVVDRGDAVGALLLQLDVEHAAVLAGGRVLRLHGAAVRGGDHHRFQAQRHVIEVEQVVGDRTVDGDPRRVAGDHGLRGQQPGLVGQGREGKGSGQSGGEDERALHAEDSRVIDEVRALPAEVIRPLGCCDGVGSLSSGKGSDPGSGNYGLTARVTWPSSVAPCARPFCAAVAGQVKGIFSSSRPPTSRTASTTRV